jgi:exopolysaccharide biosynthesis polyprenyl glycosylphosphotransferase
VYRARRSGDLLNIVRRQAPDLIVCSRESARTRTVDRLLDAGVTTVRVVNTFDFYESAFGRVANHRMTKAWFTSVLDAQRGRYSTRTKRLLDIVASSVALVALLPLFAAIAIAIRCKGGPILFRQVRSGEGGRTFTMVKFRTMIPDAEHDGAVWASLDDPRVTTVGRFLRTTRLDELPQFWNVLRGEMSIVGPRPERPEYLDYLQREIPFWNRRLLLKPGITGWAQVQHAYTADVRGAARKLAYDLYYLKHRSFGFDLMIVFRTITIVLSGHGAR